ncbi:MAG TPA: hypothetical protein VMK83_05620 [Gaiellaceae bacterium]|nr:hypothetical protein [Gaiellaceae bacterium]
MRSDGSSATHEALVDELTRRLRAGDIVAGQSLDVGGETFVVQGFDPFGADGRSVYLRVPDGSSLTVRIPAE